MISLVLAGDVRGAPYHGLCRDGLLYEYDGTTPVMDPETSQQRVCANLTGRFVRSWHRDSDPAQIWHATCTATARAPGVPAITRTVEEQAIDAANGHVWLDYLPVPRGETVTKLHGNGITDNERQRNWLIAQGRGDVWRAKIMACTFNKPADTWTITIRADRYGRHLVAPEYVEHTIQVTGCGIPPTYVQQPTTTGFASLAIDETDDGIRVLVGLCEWYVMGDSDLIPRLLSIIEIDLTDWPLEPAATVLADYEACIGSRQWTTTTTYSGFLEEGADECYSAYGVPGHYSSESGSSTESTTTTVWAWYDGTTAQLLRMDTAQSTSGSTTWSEGSGGGFLNKVSSSSGSKDIVIQDGVSTLFQCGGVWSQSQTNTDTYPEPSSAVWSASFSGTGGWAVNVDGQDGGQFVLQPPEEWPICIGQDPSGGGTTVGSEIKTNDLYANTDSVSTPVGGGGILLLRSRRQVMVAQIYWPGRQAGQYAVCDILSPPSIGTTEPPAGIQTGVLYFAVDDQHGQRVDSAPNHWM